MPRSKRELNLLEISSSLIGLPNYPYRISSSLIGSPNYPLSLLDIIILGKILLATDPGFLSDWLEYFESFPDGPVSDAGAALRIPISTLFYDDLLSVVIIEKWLIDHVFEVFAQST